MSGPLDVLIWIAEHLTWWWLAVLAPSVLAWAYWVLRPTGRHRRPHTGQPGTGEPRPEPPVDEEPPVGRPRTEPPRVDWPPTSDVDDADTISFRRVAVPGGELGGLGQG